MLMYVLFILFSTIIICQSSNFADFRNKHYHQELTNSEVKYLARLTNITHLDELLDNICVPRIVGTEKHDTVHKYIVSQLTQLGLNVEIDSFQDRTPIFGVLNFRNIIATAKPHADRYLVLACHYDSKYFPDFDFEGATDSAVPCAMMLNLAHLMREELARAKEIDLKLIFFDGEEAFKQWGKKDSIYGARHLAALYSEKVGTTKSGFSVSELSKIDLFILLDLIGAPQPTFYNNFRGTAKWYKRLVDIEQRLKNMNLLVNPSTYFQRRDNNANIIEDDHVPFLARGVPIVHLIPIPFPDVWHTVGDNRDFVDMPTVEHINQILRVFVAEYLHLSVQS